MGLKKTYSKTYTSYSGCDMVASISVPWKNKPIVIGELQTVSYSSHREVVPVRSLGRIGQKGYARGPRTVAGSLIFTVFDRNIVHAIMEDAVFYLNEKYASIAATANYIMDEMPPFDIQIVMQNEHGQASGLAIKGLVITDEGQVMSIEDLLTENTYTFIAQELVPLKRLV